ncbi:NRT1/ PTR family 5.2-like protein [Tanacetum coccineum]
MDKKTTQSNPPTPEKPPMPPISSFSTGGSSSQQHTHQPMSPISSFPMIKESTDEHDIGDEYLTDGYLTEKEQQQLLLDEEALREKMKEQQEEETLLVLEEQQRRMATEKEENGNPVLRSKRGGWKACSFIVVGTGGTKPNISTIGADQFDDFDPKEKNQKLSFFNWWMFSIFFGTLFANTVLLEHLFIGTKFLQAALLTKWPGAILAAQKQVEGLSRLIQNMRSCTMNLKFVRVLKQSVFRTEATSAPGFILHTMIAQISTLFVKQGTTLERHIGSFEIPPASLAGFVTLSMLISVVLYDRYFVTIMAKWTKNPRGISLLQRMGTGMVIHIVIMVVASLTDRYRLSVAKDHGVVESGKQIPLSIFVILPQFVLMGVADAFLDANFVETPLFFLVMTKFYVYKAEVSDSMIILEEELKLKSAATDHEVVAKQEAASRFNLT